MTFFVKNQIIKKVQEFYFYLISYTLRGLHIVKKSQKDIFESFPKIFLIVNKKKKRTEQYCIYFVSTLTGEEYHPESGSCFLKKSPPLKNYTLYFSPPT